MRPADDAAGRVRLAFSQSHMTLLSDLGDDVAAVLDDRAALAAELDRLKARIATLLPDPQPIGDDGMVHHGDFSHTQGLQCDECPDYPHASCVNERHLRTLLGGSDE